MPSFDVTRETGTFQFWQKLQDCLNDIHRELFMRHWHVNTTLSTVIDDHKQHFDMKIASDNIKKYRLARDNRQDMKCDTAETTSINFF